MSSSNIFVLGDDERRLCTNTLSALQKLLRSRNFEPVNYYYFAKLLLGLQRIPTPLDDISLSFSIVRRVGDQSLAQCILLDDSCLVMYCNEHSATLVSRKTVLEIKTGAKASTFHADEVNSWCHFFVKAMAEENFEVHFNDLKPGTQVLWDTNRPTEGQKVSEELSTSGPGYEYACDYIDFEGQWQTALIHAENIEKAQSFMEEEFKEKASFIDRIYLNETD
jgi:hypothetical protein